MGKFKTAQGMTTIVTGKNRSRVALVQEVLAHYRGALFALLDRSDDLEFTFFSAGREAEGVAAIPVSAVKRHRRAPAHRLGTIRWQRGIAGLGLSREFDVLLLVGDVHDLSTWVAALLARLRGTPVLFWTHGWRRREPLPKRLVRLAFYHLADRLLIYGERGKRLGVEAGYPADRMTVVYNSLDLDRADAIVDRIERGAASGGHPSALFCDPERPLLICTARLTEECRFDLLLEAAAILNSRGTPVNVLLVGDGPMRAGLEQRARALALDVHFAGAVYDEERVGTWLYHADLAVSPGKVGLTAIHSMMYGTPVVTHGDLDRQMPEVEAVVPGETGALFARGDAGALARTVADWLATGHDRAETRVRCREVINRRWSPHSQARAFEEAVVRLSEQTKSPPSATTPGRVALVWDNLRPGHDDCLRSLADAGYAVSAIELFSSSADYTWHESLDPRYAVTTLARDRGRVGELRLALRIARAVWSAGSRHVVMSHYQRPSIFLAACLLRASGRRVYTVLDSKFDDYARRWTRTLLKVVMMTPYRGALVASRRSRDYVAYLGISRARIELGCDTLDTSRLRRLAGDEPRPAFAERPFLVVARLVPKKNIAGALDAYSRYRALGGTRSLVVLGDGTLAQQLRDTAAALGIANSVQWLGAQPRPAVMRAMRDAVALLVPSFEEQFGQVVLEALALGLPVIASNNAGAVDLLVDNLVNGYVIDPHKPHELVAAMMALDDDEAVHARMSRAAIEAGERGDVRHFVEGVGRLLGARDAFSGEQRSPIIQ